MAYYKDWRRSHPVVILLPDEMEYNANNIADAKVFFQFHSVLP